MDIVLRILFFLLIGGAAGALLTFAGKLFFVKTDETVEKITEALPGANCGGCGFAGCADYADAIASGKAKPNLCSPGGLEVNRKISGILGVAVEETEPMVAYVHCNGCNGAVMDKFVYAGTKSCIAAEKFYNGKSDCSFGCLGFGDCVNACDSGGIEIRNGVAVINPSKCIACGKCVKACPNHLISMKKKSALMAVRCSSGDIGKITRAVCKNGCIGCGLCVKKCPEGAMALNNNHAEIDYNKCKSCGICADACPVKCIEILSRCADEEKNNKE